MNECQTGPLNILLVDGGAFHKPLSALGHNVLFFSPRDPGNIDVPLLLQQHNFTPDLIFQTESLARRLVLHGLPSIPCVKIFWAIDSHLNLFWQRYYARLFDGVLTPHLSLWEALPPEWRHPHVQRFTKPGYARPFKPHARRQHLLSLIGVLNKHRPLRNNLAKLLLEEFGVEARQGMPFKEMLELYDDTRIVPNQSIAKEVNYRLMEAASCGAVPLTQDVGEDQDSQFIPGREILIYHDAVELLAHIRTLADNPELAESIGRAAWERVQRDHLMDNRLREFLEFAAKLKQSVAETPPAERPSSLSTTKEICAVWLTKIQMHRAWQIEQYPEDLLKQGQAFLQAGNWPAEGLAYLARLAAEYDGPAAAKPILDQVLSGNVFKNSLDLNLACSMIAVHLNDFNTACLFWYRQQLYGTAPNKATRESKPGTAFDLCLAWADLLSKAGRAAQLGLTVNMATGIPECAWSTLLYAETLPEAAQPANRHLVMQKLVALTATIKGLEFFHMGFMARLCLLEPDNRRLQERYAQACLQAFLLKEGLEEAAQAKSNCVK